MEKEGLNMTSSVMMEKLANLFMDIMTWNNVPTDASSSEWYSFDTYDERKYFFFSTLSILFLLWQEASASYLFATGFWQWVNHQLWCSHLQSVVQTQMA